MAVDVVGQYWRGVAQRLSAEVDVMNQLIAHNLTKGEANEAALSRVVENLIPARFGVGSGLLIDSEGHYSRQLDIIIFDRADEPSILAQAGQVLFPVEIARLCIEVKTNADTDAVADTRKKKTSIEQLQSTSTPAPPLALFGFGSSSTCSTLAERLEPASAEAGSRPDAAVVLNKAFIARTHDHQWVSGVTALQEQDEAGVLLGTAQVAGEGEGRSVVRGGSVYPVVEVPAGRWVIGEPARALLLFCEWMLEVLLADDARPLTLTAYLNDAARDLQQL